MYPYIFTKNICKSTCKANIFWRTTAGYRNMSEYVENNTGLTNMSWSPRVKTCYYSLLTVYFNSIFNYHNGSMSSTFETSNRTHAESPSHFWILPSG